MQTQAQEYTLEPARYFDYRDFIKVRYESLKTKNKKFSLQAFAQKSGLSKSLIQFLLNKKRHLSLDKMPRLAQSLRLTEEEEYFVYLMVCMESSKNKRVREHFDGILTRLRNQYLPREGQSLDPRHGTSQVNADLHGDILQLTLQAMCGLEGFQEEAEWIVQNLKIPNISVENIRAALKKLEKNEWILRDENQRIKPKGNFHFSPDPYDPNGQSVYTKTARVLAELMAEPKIYRPSIYMQLMLSMDEENLKKAELLMIEMHQRLSELAKTSTRKTAAIYFGNYMLTVARLMK